MSATRRALEFLCIALFAGGLAAPTLDHFVRPDAVRSTLRENRTPAPQPNWPRRASQLPDFPARFTRHFDDHLGLRDQLLGWRNRTLIELLRARTAPGFLPGRDGWMFFVGEGVLDDHRGLKRLEPELREQWIARLLERTRWLRARGARYLHVVAPDKESIYPDLLPRPLEALGPTRLDQLLDTLRPYPEIEFIDLRPVLIGEREHDGPRDAVYHPRGTHWTARGAWAVACELARRMQRDFPAVVPARREDFVRAPLDERRRDDVAVFQYLDGVFEDTAFEFVPRQGWRAPPIERAYSEEGERLSELDLPGLPRVLLWHDSFGPSLQSQLAEYCARLRCIWAYTVSEAEVVAERPDFVISCYVERSLNHGPLQDLRVAQLMEVADFERLSERAFVFDPALGAAQARLSIEPGLVTRALPGEPGDATGGALELLVERSSACLALNVEAPPHGSRVGLSITTRCAGADTLEVFFTTRARDGFSRGQAAQLELEAGTHTRLLQLPTDDFAGGLKLRFGGRSGALALLALELRYERSGQ